MFEWANDSASQAIGIQVLILIMSEPMLASGVLQLSCATAAKAIVTHFHEHCDVL
jgi:hypothetical protein